ncbi:MAG: cupin domain-containing protein [Acidimicrobiales bacterium]|jgi:hypothetical protein|nr:hypothetical protein [Acidimicrobiaceae bacterium]MDP6162256.1 cupin domain-containing protein [Acidimicrobiales bacterium]MDP6285340.1 cupin domain-containing protein [Acidimicrobiales bacterium]HJO41229.1 cupin domain-containing protein [Acidimicrobiales bacterium]|tara:strand:+ start:1637 stop:2098 length:462 start_codon:yes stop_codon:yes gene_type:complete
MLDKEKTAEEISDILDLEPLPLEGGMWTQTFKDKNSTGIYYLLSKNNFSAMHKLEATEIYHYYAGAPAQMLLLDSVGKIEEPVLGADLDSGHRPQIIVESGVWQGSRTTGEWTLLGTTMAPPYSQEMFQLADREELLKGWPDIEQKIYELTRS